VSESSHARLVAERLVAELGPEGARRAIVAICAKLSPVERAALAARWPFWARPKQLPPGNDWRSWGFLAGRMFGKTRSIAERINDRVQAGVYKLVGVIAQNETNAIKVQVEGKSGLIATAPPWCRPTFRPSDNVLEWPNGALGHVLTPEAPDAPRGFEFDASWLSECQSWPVATRWLAYTNVLFATRSGPAQILWDATGKKGHPILLDRLQLAREMPDKHLIVRGSSRENAANVGAGVVDELERKFAGTREGREELDGDTREDEESDCIARVEWIEPHRRVLPATLARRGLGIDPAITARAGSDRTGIVDAGVDHARHGYVIDDFTGKYPPHAWAKLALDRYVDQALDIIVVETNRGGDLVTQNLRAAAAERRLQVVVLGEKDRPRGQRGIVYVKEVHSRGEKADRARPLSTAYERGRISHVIGGNLTSIEKTLTTWEPSPGMRWSPDDLDALNAIMSELLGLTDDALDPAGAFPGIVEAGRILAGGTAARQVGTLLGPTRGRRDRL